MDQPFWLTGLLVGQYNNTEKSQSLF